MEPIVKKPHGNTGKKRPGPKRVYSPEERARISASLKGKNLGKTHTDAAKAKMKASAVNRQRPPAFTDEHIKRLSRPQNSTIDWMLRNGEAHVVSYEPDDSSKVNIMIRGKGVVRVNLKRKGKPLPFLGKYE